MKPEQVTGIALWIVFYGSYAGKAFLGKRKGISVSRMARGVKPLSTRAVEAFLLVITVGGALVSLLSIAFYGEWPLVFGKNAGAETGRILLVTGAAVSAAGCILFILAMRQMKDSWRAGVDESQETSFVTDGIYSVSRNPAFAGFDLLYIGFGLMFSNGLQLLFTLLGVFTFHMQIKEEEAYMEKRWGKAYLEYKNKTARYLSADFLQKRRNT